MPIYIYYILLWKKHMGLLHLEVRERELLRWLTTLLSIKILWDYRQQLQLTSHTKKEWHQQQIQPSIYINFLGLYKFYWVLCFGLNIPSVSRANV